MSGGGCSCNTCGKIYVGEEWQDGLCKNWPKHCTENENCWCEPEIEICGESKIIIHTKGH